MFSVWTYGKFDILFEWMKSSPTFSGFGRRRELADKLKQALDVEIPDELLDRRPSYELATLTPEKLQALLRAFEWADNEISTQAN